MPKWRKKKTDFDRREIALTKADWEAESPGELRSMLLELHLIREFETKLLDLANAGLVHGPVHMSVGQEAVAVGAMAALRRSDGIAGTHRAHHQYLAKACDYLLPDDFDPARDALPDALRDEVRVLMAEIMGLAPGCCGGRGGSMHLCNPDIGVLGTNAIVGGGVPVATGSAWAETYRGSERVVACFFGDGALNQGALHEALNLGALWKARAVYVLENNCYAVATGLEEAFPVRDLSVRAAGYGMPARIVDGMDPLAVKLALAEASGIVREGGGPVFVEARTFRYFHHAGGTPGSAFGYRTKAEEAKWRKLDPVETFAAKLRRMKVLSAGEAERLHSVAKAVVDEAAESCLATDGSGATVVAPALWPKPASLTEHIRSDGGELADVRYVEAEDAECATEAKYVEAIAGATEWWLEHDPDVFVLGEEVGHMKGGAYQATKGLAGRYPGRVRDTPISEAGFSGLACGAAMSGLRPIVEIMFPDFALVAADQVFNQIGKLRHMYGGRVEVPLVMRTRIAVGCGYGGQHSGDPVALFALFPGWTIVAPVTPFDYVGLFNAAMRRRDPVLIVEHHTLYDTLGPVPDDFGECFVRIGSAKRLTEGADATVLAYSSTVPLALSAAEELASGGIAAEVIDLRTLSMPDIDYDTIGGSLRKTGRMVVVEQAPASNSIGARIAGECQRRFFDLLDGPVLCVTGADVPYPVSRVLEAACVPGVEDVCRAVSDLVEGKV